MDIQAFKRLPIMGILRGIDEEMVEPIVATALSSGLETIEVTMNTPEAARLVRRMADAGRGRLAIGAGTVLTLDDLHRARDAGASFIVLPTLVEDVVQECVRYKIPVFPGALTPGEISRAWSAGAAMVKVFPARVFGPEYMKDLKGPFQDVQLLACGGVTSENIRSYFSCGAAGVAFGGGIFRKEWLRAKEYGRIGEALKTFIGRYLAWRDRKTDEPV